VDCMAKRTLESGFLLCFVKVKLVKLGSSSPARANTEYMTMKGSRINFTSA